MLQRRGLLSGLGGLLAAPALIRPGVLMPVSITPFIDLRSAGSFAALVDEMNRVVQAQLGAGPGRIFDAVGLRGLHQSYVVLNIPTRDIYGEPMSVMRERYLRPAATALAHRLQGRAIGTEPLPIPVGVDEAATSVRRGIAMRGVRAYSIAEDCYVSRFDVMHT